MGLKTKFLLAALAYLFVGCNAYLVDDAQIDIRNSFTQGDYEQSQLMLNRLKEKNVYKSKDDVLFNLEAGIIHHFAGNYDSSSVFLNTAETKIDENFTKSISRGIGSILGNDNNLVYDGEAYEDIYLNAFKSLNFIHQQDWEAALVESRRMAFKMEQLDIKTKGLAEAFSKADTTGKVEWKSNEVNLQNSALSHYLSTVLFTKTGKIDNARIEYEKLQIALKDQEAIRRSPLPSNDYLENLNNPNSYNVLISAFTGQAPIKFQEDVRVFTGMDDNLYVKFSLPVLRLIPSEVQSIRMIVNGEIKKDLAIIEEMDDVAAEVYKSKQPIIYARALLRSSVKATAGKLITDQAEKKSDGLGFLFNVLNFFTQEISEKADLRGWQTMPGQAWMKVISLPEGSNTVKLEYRNRFNKVVYFDEFEVEITPQTNLQLIESIYSF